MIENIFLLSFENSKSAVKKCSYKHSNFKHLERIEMNFFADNIPALNIYDKSTNYMLYKSKNHVTTAQKCNDNS